MADLINKENVSPVRLHSSPFKAGHPSPGRKSSRRPRSKSIGPGAEDVLGPQKPSSPEKDRRKSMFAPMVKSILPSKEDEAKRREARRKSLANRRVSFAPEATLHTWDVIEYMREATTSSNGSPRRQSRNDGDDEEDDGTDSIPATPDNNFRAQQKKRRRSSAIPPLNFNDPDDAYSSSPVGSSPVGESDEETGEFDDEDEDEEMGGMDDDETAMSLVSADNTADLTLQSNVSSGTSDSSARLDAALRQAAEQAGTRGIEYDEFGYDEAPAKEQEEAQQQQQDSQIWAGQAGMLTPMAKNLMALQEQENVNPFSPAFRAHGRPSTIVEEDEEESGEMTMEMTRAVGGIHGFGEGDSAGDDMTMDFTQVGGKIFQSSPVKGVAKRGRTTTDTGSPMAEADGARPAKRRRSSNMRSSLGDGTMEFTSAFGAIRQPPQFIDPAEATMEFTTAIGNIVRSQSPLKVSRRQSVRRRRSSVQSNMSAADQTMDFTTAIGAIKSVQFSPAKSIAEEDSNEDMSMELTVALGNVTEEVPIPSRPTTPKHLSSPAQADPPTTPKDQDRFREATDLSAKKLLTPVLMKEAGISPVSTPRQKSPVRSATKASTPNSLARSPNRTPIQLPPPKNSSPMRSPYPTLPDAKSVLTPTQLSARKSTAQSTPEIKVSPSRRQLSSPFKAERSPVKPVIKSPVRASPAREPAPTLLDSIRTMATPRKEAQTPLNRLKEMTPRRTPVRATTPRVKIQTPKIEISAPAAPAPLTRFGDDEATRQLGEELARGTSTGPAITLNGFLDMARIKFMDLTATKRRYTAAPTPAKSSAARRDASSSADDATEFEEAVAAGACALPELDLYAHSCRELKKYMSEGRAFLRALEDEVAAEAPPFMRAYAQGSAEQRAQWDRLISDVRTRSRLHSKELWYGWRTQLLQGLQEGLRGVERGLDSDAAELRARKERIQEVLPSALEERERLLRELAELRETADQHSSDDKEELDAARDKLLEVDAEVVETREALEQLRAELEEQERMAEMLLESKNEATAAIAEAQRVKEASRGISKEEMAAYQASVTALERATKWVVTAASGPSLTMTYRGALQLYFNPAAFMPVSTTPAPKSRSPSKRMASDAPISLTYVSEEALTTEKRFFLQLLRAQLHTIDQSITPARSLLAFISSGWDIAELVAQSVRKVQLEQPVEVKILSDEQLAVEVSMLLPQVQTRVVLQFEVQATVAEDGPDMKVETSTTTSGKVVYGEPYKEGKMGEFLGARIGKAMESAETAVRDLRTRLEKTGRKSVGQAA